MKDLYQISHSRDEYVDPIEFHSHDFYEIYFFTDGNVTYYIENESYNLKRGDVLIIPPGKLHRPVIENSIPYERYVLWLFGKFVDRQTELKVMLNRIDDLSVLKGTRLCSFQNDKYEYFVTLFNKLSDKFSLGDEDAYYVCNSCIVLIVNELLEALNTAPANQTKNGDMIAEVISYINKNLKNTPSLDELSEIFFVSKYYLAHKFKEYAKTSVHKYILMKKINYAKQLLKQGRSPCEVCCECGFSTYSNFYKEFTKHTGRSPKEYRYRNDCLR